MKKLLLLVALAGAAVGGAIAGEDAGFRGERELPGKFSGVPGTQDAARAVAKAWAEEWHHARNVEVTKLLPRGKDRVIAVTREGAHACRITMDAAPDLPKYGWLVTNVDCKN